MDNPNAESWRGLLGEDDMTEADWLNRAGQQARAMLHAGDPMIANPDEDGVPTAGCYNGDYPDSWHQEKNEELANSANVAHTVAKRLRKILDC